MNENSCPACGEFRKKETPRSGAGVRELENRINRMVGQLGGIKKMLDDNRYCGDILVQIAAVERALQGLGYLVLEEHMETCVREAVLRGDEKIMSETMELIRKLK